LELISNFEHHKVSYLFKRTQRMPIITLTSDWGLKDHYLAVVKGTILNRIPNATVVDISHDIPPFNLKQASFIIKNAYHHFPAGTIHIIALNTIATDGSPHVVVANDGQYFIGADSGIFSLIFDHFPDAIVELNMEIAGDRPTFTTPDLFVEAAIHLAQGKKIDKLGDTRSEWFQQLLFKPAVSGNIMKGIVIYIDNYENVITNITQKIFDETRNGRRFTIEFRGHEIHEISNSYLDVNPSEILALFGSTGHLEVAITQGNASSLLGLRPDDPVSIHFFD